MQFKTKYILRRISNSRNTGCEIINQGSSAVSGCDGIVNPKPERNLIALLLQKKSNIFEFETALSHELIFFLCLAEVLCLILGIQFKCRMLG